MTESRDPESDIGIAEIFGCAAGTKNFGDSKAAIFPKDSKISEILEPLGSPQETF